MSSSKPKIATPVFAGLLLSFAIAQLQAEDQLVYVKKDSRRATRDASLEASGQAKLPADWHLIGPFDNANNAGFDKVYPPEEKVDLSAEYPAVKGNAKWRKMSFGDGRVHSLRRFDADGPLVCYLYRQINSPEAKKMRVSLGSDDGIKVWLNGELLFANDVKRGATAGQDYVTLPLREGNNDLLMKVVNREGRTWAFYFAPTLPERLLVALDRQLDRDFPTSDATSYRIESLPLPDNEMIEVGGLAFRPDGKLYIATRRGDVWLVSNPLSDDVSQITMRRYATGLHEVLGLRVVGDDLYLVQRPEVTLLRDTNGDDEADEYLTVCDSFGISGDYHEYIYGPARDHEGNFFLTLNLGFGGGHRAKVPYRGCALKIDSSGAITPWAYGLRSPNGVNFSPDGRLYCTDNQGEWIATCKLQELRQGEFYGHVDSVRWWPGGKEGSPPKPVPPAIWFPFGLSRSASEPVWDTTGGKFGPFAGQCFVGEVTNSLVVRATLEEVGGRMQGACYPFRKGFACGVNRLLFAPDGSLVVGETNRGWGSIGGSIHGVQRLIYTGREPFEVLEMSATPDGWKLTFTRPIDRAIAAEAKRYFVESYTYHYWETYGSPEIKRRQEKIESVTVAEDGKSVRIVVPNRELGRVFHLKLSGIVSADAAALANQDAYYTLNAVPESGSQTASK